MLTDNEIRALRENSARTQKTGIDLQGDDITELCARVLEAAARVKVLEDALLTIVKEYSSGAMFNFLGDPEAHPSIRRARKALEPSLSPEHKLG